MKISPEVLDRAQGCLLGQLAGDSLGSLVEFKSQEEISGLYPDGVRKLADGGVWDTLAGQPTDDSEMALMLARSLIKEGKYNAKKVMESYQYWLNSGPFDLGGTISSSLRGYPNPNSQANGALMRVSPLGIFGTGSDLPNVAALARKDAALTHVHPICQEINALFAMAIAWAIEMGPSPGALFGEIQNWARDMVVDGSILEVIARAENEPPEDFMVQQGWVMKAFQNALFQLLHTPSLEEGVVDTVGRGGDTDTNAAICGALMGAVYGRAQIPGQWEKCILSCRPNAFDKEVPKPRPEVFWPVDALELAEALLR
ncbi:MAG: ADP-ribosylglycohydrolase family protein [Gemmatimonadales bacterium]|nr:ADP-ribosylglycohydrolase family protein [Gemmatimonadales bacterium]